MDLTTIHMPWYGFPFDSDRQPPLEQCLTLDLESVTLDELVEKLSQQATVPIRLSSRAFAAFARNPLLRVLAWGAGGAGLGDVLLAVLVGGLGAGDFLTPMGIVLALVGTVIGYRTVPPASHGGPPVVSN